MKKKLINFSRLLNSRFDFHQRDAGLRLTITFVIFFLIKQVSTFNKVSNPFYIISKTSVMRFVISSAIFIALLIPIHGFSQPGTTMKSPGLKMDLPRGSRPEADRNTIQRNNSLLDSFIIEKDWGLTKAGPEIFVTNFDSLKNRLAQAKWNVKMEGSGGIYRFQKDNSSLVAIVTGNAEEAVVAMKPCIIPASAQPFAEVNKIVAGDRFNVDQFGQAVSISNNYAVAGVRLEDEDADGKNTMNDAGSAYIFERGSDNKWKQVQKIVASDRTAGDNFGWAVGISGNYIVVGAPYEDEDVSGRNTMSSSGSAYVFERNANGTWSEVQKVVCSHRGNGNYFGTSVAIDGNTIVVGSIGHSYDETDRLESNINDAGALFVFEKKGNNWRQTQKIVANDHTAANLGDNLGISVSISGNYIIAGAWGADLDANGGNRMEASGAAYIFEKGADGRWKQAKKLVASDRAPYDEFGFSVAISGDNAIVGAERKTETADPNSRYYTGNAYIFSLNAIRHTNPQGGVILPPDDGLGWREIQKINPVDRKGEDKLGWSVAMNGDYAAIGCPGSDFKPMSNEGAVYVYWQNFSGQWTQSQKLFSSDKGTFAGMGIAVALSKNAIIAGAIIEHRDAMGKNELSNAGAAYIFMKGAKENKPATKPVTPKPTRN